MNLQTTVWFVGGTVLPSLVVSWAAAYYIRRRAPRWGLVDEPGARKVHTTPTPLGGGLAIWLGVIAPLAIGHLVLWGSVLGQAGEPGATIPTTPVLRFVQMHVAGLAQQSGKLWALLGGGTILMIVGLVDDRRGLDWKLRLAVQVAVASLAVYWQGWRLTAYVDVPLVTGLLSVLWIVALVNAFNMLDNMDGLSAGVATIAAATLAAVLLVAPDPETSRPQWFVAGFLLVVVGSLAGFLWHNRPPARLFMGDAGSYFVGFCIAIATLQATFADYGAGSRHAILAPICVMAVPLYDMVTVLWIRLSEGHSPFQADTNHFSHRLVDLGLSKGQAVLVIYLATATCGVGALLLHRVDGRGATIIILVIACVLWLIAILETVARRNVKS